MFCRPMLLELSQTAFKISKDSHVLLYRGDSSFATVKQEFGVRGRQLRKSSIWPHATVPVGQSALVLRS